MHADSQPVKRQRTATLADQAMFTSAAVNLRGGSVCIWAASALQATKQAAVPAALTRSAIQRVTAVLILCFSRVDHVLIMRGSYHPT
jgi:hypothetical protein